MKKIILTLGLQLIVSFGQKACAQDAYLGDIKLTAITYDQENWMPCDGSLLPIALYTDLFALIGTTYGGDGLTNFALPDLRGRVPVGRGTGSGLTLRNQGDMSGTETNTLSEAQMPSHSHVVNAVADNGNQSVPTGNFLAGSKVLDRGFSNASIGNTTMNTNMIASTGGSQPVNNMQPYTVVRYVICVQGSYPPN